MADYQILKDSITGTECAIKRRADDACIPMDPENTDYAAYLAWVAAGNTPDPAS
ncbi:MAG TPA: hypothetical protein VMU59_09265 [Caulobacteraceae bacterium]|nr:hypothetical protein [Caulobacteraceae bacterium]